MVNGGPASLVICYTIVGVLMLCTMMSLGELAVMYPVNGGYYEYSVRFVDHSWYVVARPKAGRIGAPATLPQCLLMVRAG